MQKKKKKVSDELLFQLQSLPLQSQKTFDIIFLYCQVTYFFWDLITNLEYENCVNYFEWANKFGQTIF